MHKSDSIFVDFNIKEKIRKTELSGTEIGGASSFPFMKENDNPAKPLVALEIPYNIDEGYPDIIKEKWQGKSLPQILEEADNSNADIISIKFNISENLRIFPQIFLFQQLRRLLQFLQKSTRVGSLISASVTAEVPIPMWPSDKSLSRQLSAAHSIQ